MPAVSTANTFAFQAPARDRAARPGLFRRIARAIRESRQRQADREVARLIERGGGRMTDTLERQIERHFV